MSATTHEGRKTNERPGVRAQHRHARFSAYKAREVLDLIRNESVAEARTILQFCDRAAADTVMKVLDSAVANAANNNDIPPEELFVAACYADEGPTMKRWRPRARGRATRIRKRTCHITVIVGRYSGAELDAIRDRLATRGRTSSDASADRARRVARSRAAAEGDDDAGSPSEDELDAAATEATVEDAFVDDAEQLAADEAAETDTADADEAQDADDATDDDATDDDATDADATDADATDDDQKDD